MVIAILISNKLDIQIKVVQAHEEGHFMPIQGTTYPEDYNSKHKCTKHKRTYYYYM